MRDEHALRGTSKTERSSHPSPARHDHTAEDQRRAREEEEDLARASGVALRRAHLVEQIERGRRASGKLGFAHVDYGRLFQRDHWTMFAIARELGCSVEDLLPPPEPTRESRVAWSDLVVASELVLGEVRTANPSVRDVLALAARGMGMRQMLRLLPGRLSFSIAQDLAEGLAAIVARQSQSVLLLARSDHQTFLLSTGPRRASNRAH